jgi:hypothetical protein
MKYCVFGIKDEKNITYFSKVVVLIFIWHEVVTLLRVQVEL